jgi:hypothetical protein
MLEDVSSFISDAGYNGRLHPDPVNARQHLVLDKKAHPLQRPTGLFYVPIC